LAASLMHTLCVLGLGAVFSLSSSIHEISSAFEILIVPFVIGLAGLFVFSRRSEKFESLSPTLNYDPMPGDGTIAFLNKIGILLTFIAGFAGYLWSIWWMRSTGVDSYHGAFGFVIVVLIALVIMTLHELGHTVTGLM